MKYTNLDDWLSSRGFLTFFAFALAFALWLYVVGNRNEEIAKEYEVRLEFLNPPSGLALFPSVRSALIALNGERRAMNSLQTSKLVSEVDLKGLGAGRHSLPILFKAPPKTAVTQISPKDVEVELARLTEKELKVRVLPPEEMPPGYIMDGAVVSPETVKAHGREDQLASLTEIVVRPTTENLFEGGTWKIPLRAPAGTTLDFSPPDVTLSATYYQGIPRKELPIEVRTRGSLPPNLRLVSTKVSPENLPVEGRSEAFEGVDKLYTDPVNLSRLTKSQTVQTKVTNIPKGLSMLAPPIVSVTFELKTLNDTKSYKDVTILFEGVPEDAQWIAEPASVTVLVEGARSILDAMTPEKLELSAYVDVSSIVTPSVRLPVRIRTRQNSGVEIVGIEPSTVKVTRRQPQNQQPNN